MHLCHDGVDATECILATVSMVSKFLSVIFCFLGGFDFEPFPASFYTGGRKGPR